MNSKCYGLAIRRGSRILTRLYDELLQPCGMNLTQFGIANHLFESGLQTIGELASFADTEKTAMGRNLHPLERDGLIQITTGEDRRMRMVSLTAKGKACVKKGRQILPKAQKSIEARLGKQRAVALLSLLNEMSERLSGKPPA